MPPGVGYGAQQRHFQTVTRGKPVTPEYDPFKDVSRAQDFAREGVQAYGELLRPELMQEIGSTIGGLNEIGALRSGGTKVALGDLQDRFTNRIGQFASQATLGAIGQGLGAGGLRLQKEGLDVEREQIKAQRRASLLGAIGSVVGAGIGFAIGGPAGAAIGGSVGGSAPRALGGGSTGT